MHVGKVLTALFVLSIGAPRVQADDARAAVSTINHAFATELGTGFYDMGGRSVFIVSVSPSWDLRTATDTHPGVRLVVPMAGGSFDLTPHTALNGDLPSHIDSFSIMPGLEFDIPLQHDWLLTPWVRTGASFAEGTSDGWLYGAGVRLSRDEKWDQWSVSRLHEVGLVGVNYYSSQPTDNFLRMRNAFDLRRPSLPLGKNHRLLAGPYAILDLVPDAPATPTGVGKQSLVQLEAGLTFNSDPRAKLWLLRWPRIGVGYRFAGHFSGWRIVIGAPF